MAQTSCSLRGGRRKGGKCITGQFGEPKTKGFPMDTFGRAKNAITRAVQFRTGKARDRIITKACRILRTRYHTVTPICSSRAHESTSLSKKREHFVNLYRRAWGSNVGLTTERIRSMSEKELDRSIDSLSNLSWVKGANEKLVLPRDYYRRLKAREGWLYRKWMEGKITRKQLDDGVLKLYDEAEMVSGKGAGELHRISSVRLVIS